MVSCAARCARRARNGLPGFASASVGSEPLTFFLRGYGIHHQSLPYVIEEPCSTGVPSVADSREFFWTRKIHCRDNKIKGQSLCCRMSYQSSSSSSWQLNVSIKEGSQTQVSMALITSNQAVPPALWLDLVVSAGCSDHNETRPDGSASFLGKGPFRTRTSTGSPTHVPVSLHGSRPPLLLGGGPLHLAIFPGKPAATDREVRPFSSRAESISGHMIAIFNRRIVPGRSPCACPCSAGREVRILAMCW